MQRTRFDNWLIKQFAYKTKVQCHRVPEHVDKKLLKKGSLQELPPESSNGFEYQMVFKKQRDADLCIQQLKSQNMLFAASVEDRKGFFSRFVRKSDRSVTFFVIGRVLTLISLLSLAYLALILLSRPEVSQLLKDAWKQFNDLSQ